MEQPKKENQPNTIAHLSTNASKFEIFSRGERTNRDWLAVKSLIYSDATLTVFSFSKPSLAMAGRRVTKWEASA